MKNFVGIGSVVFAGILNKVFGRPGYSFISILAQRPHSVRLFASFIRAPPSRVSLLLNSFIGTLKLCKMPQSSMYWPYVLKLDQKFKVKKFVGIEI